MKKIVKIFTLLSFGFLSLVSLAQAGEQSLVADNLVAEGKNYYASGDYPRAIHEFSKALLVAPNHEEAQYYLNELGINVGLLYGRNKTKLYHLAHMAKNIDWYKAEMAKLEKDSKEKARLAELLAQEREKLNQMLLNKEAENVLLRSKVDEVQQHFQKKISADRAMLDEKEKLSAKKDKEIACLNDEVCALEQTLVTKVALLEDKEKKVEEFARNIRDIKKESKLRAAQDRAMINGIEKVAEQKSKEIARLNMDMLQVKGHLDKKEELIKEKDQAVKDLSSEIKNLERELSSTEQRWQATKLDYEKQIQDYEKKMTDQLALKTKEEEDYQGKLKDLTKMLREKRAELSVKNNKIVAQEYKLEIAQKNLEVKNKIIDGLRKSLTALDQELVLVQARNRQEMQGRTAKAKAGPDEQRVGFIKRQDRLIAMLKDKLASTRSEIADLEKERGASVDKLLELKEQLTEVKLQLNERAASLDSNEDYKLLDTRLQDTQDRLDEVVQMTKDKETQTKKLQQQIEEVMSQANH